MAAKRKKLKINPLALRRNMGLNQNDFWAALGVTQSGGSRYENGRTMPKPVATLLDLVHVKQLDLKRIEPHDMRILAYLKQEKPDLYRALTKAIDC